MQEVVVGNDFCVPGTELGPFLDWRAKEPGRWGNGVCGKEARECGQCGLRPVVRDPAPPRPRAQSGQQEAKVGGAVMAPCQIILAPSTVWREWGMPRKGSRTLFMETSL